MPVISKTEDILYEALNRIGLYPKRQYPISRMHVDFAFPEYMVVVEVDGAYKRDKDGMRTLFRRREVAENLGWKVKHYTAEETYENPEKIAREIKNYLGKLPKKSLIKRDYSGSNQKLIDGEWEREDRAKEFLNKHKSIEEKLNEEFQNDPLYGRYIPQKKKKLLNIILKPKVFDLIIFIAFVIFIFSLLFNGVERSFFGFLTHNGIIFGIFALIPILLLLLLVYYFLMSWWVDWIRKGIYRLYNGKWGS